MPVVEWWVYILRCADDSLYTGICTDTERRLHEHNHSAKGARYTRARRPVELVYQEPHTSRSTASRREAEIKKMRRLQKIKLLS